MTLYNFGHGQTLQYFSRHGKDYFLVVCKATNLTLKDDPEASFNWGIQIGRLEFKDNATIKSYTDIPRFAAINCANKSGKRFGSVYRVEAALSSDTRYLLMWMKNTTPGIQFSYYDAERLNTFLDEKKHQASKWVGCDEKRVTEACRGQAQFNMNQWGVPNSSSTQGFEFSDAQAIYISSGSHNVESSDQPKIGKYTWGHGSPSAIVQLVSPQITSRLKDNEIEGIQLKGNNVYVSEHFHKSIHDAVAQTVYQIPKSAFN